MGELHIIEVVLQGGEDPQNAFSLQVIFCERALLLVALLRKMTCKLRHPVGLRHPRLIECFTMQDPKILQGGEDSQDPLSCRLFSTKEPLNISHFCGKCKDKGSYESLPPCTQIHQLQHLDLVKCMSQSSCSSSYMFYCLQCVAAYVNMFICVCISAC